MCVMAIVIFCCFCMATKLWHMRAACIDVVIGTAWTKLSNTAVTAGFCKMARWPAATGLVLRRFKSDPG